MGNYDAASARAYAAAAVDANATMMIQHACAELAVEVAACLALMEDHAAVSADTEANPTMIQQSVEKLSGVASLPQMALKGCYSCCYYSFSYFDVTVNDA